MEKQVPCSDNPHSKSKILGKDVNPSILTRMLICEKTTEPQHRGPVALARKTDKWCFKGSLSARKIKLIYSGIESTAFRISAFVAFMASFIDHVSFRMIRNRMKPLTVQKNKKRKKKCLGSVFLSLMSGECDYSQEADSLVLFRAAYFRVKHKKSREKMGLYAARGTTYSVKTVIRIIIIRRLILDFYTIFYQNSH